MLGAPCQSSSALAKYRGKYRGTRRVAIRNAPRSAVVQLGTTWFNFVLARKKHKRPLSLAGDSCYVEVENSGIPHHPARGDGILDERSPFGSSGPPLSGYGTGQFSGPVVAGREKTHQEIACLSA